MTGLVSTIIPVYNRAGMIGAAVQSVLDQTYRPIEIILVDDGSTDNTLTELNRLAAGHPNLIRVAHRENGGPGLARETGRVLAKGEFIQYLDSDDLLLPRKFEVQVASLREHPECGIAYGRSRMIDTNGVVLLDVSKWTGKKMDFLFPAILVDRWWHTHTPLYRRELCDRIGAWVANRPEDWDYDARAGSFGTRLAFCDEVVSCQRDHSGNRVTHWAIDAYVCQEAGFLPKLHACAIQAGVAPDSPEMLHFSRWAFALSRRLARLGLYSSADSLLELARKSVPTTSLDILLYGWIARLIGRRPAAELVNLLYRCFRLHAGPQTQRQSWMKA